MDRNIFDAAAKKLGEQSRNKSKSSAKSAFSTSAPAKKKANSEISETDEMMQRMRVMQQDLDNQMAELRKLGRLHNVDVDLYLENLTKRYPQEMKKVTQAQKELLDAIDNIFSPGTCIKPNSKSKEKLTHERKSKTVAFRKKWIPMG
jgi:hypothetical protein